MEGARECRHREQAAEETPEPGTHGGLFRIDSFRLAVLGW